MSMNLNEVKKVHFIGIGGIGMSGLARLFLHEGKEVSGCDRSLTLVTESLSEEGIEIAGENNPVHISKEIDLVVYSDALPLEHPERTKARELGIPELSYFEALGLIANEYYLIAVAGTHGKSTTTAMLIDIFEEAGLDPSAIVGSLRTKTRSNYRRGKSKYFIVEADEWKRHFTNFNPDIFVITNIDHDHVDYYKDLSEVQNAFREVADKVPEEGAVVCETSNESVKPVIKSVKAQIVDYRTFFNPTTKLKVPGIHNRMNAAAAAAAASFEGIERGVIDRALENYAGIWRRFEHKGEVNGAPVYDDYSHNPQKVAAAISGARELYPDKKLTVAFQSHTYTRTHKLFADFVNSLAKADRVIMLPIYAAREENVSGVSSEQLVDAIIKKGTEAQHFDSFDEAVTLIKQTVNENDVVLVMGAGDITKVADMLIT